MRNLTFLYLFFLGLSFSSAQNLRYCDTEIKIAYPDSGHYFISPGSDSVGYWVYNHGPDTLFQNDRFWLRVLLANKYLDPPIIVFLNKILKPGDSIRFSNNIGLKFFNHVTDINLCLFLNMMNAVDSSTPLFIEKDSADMYANNKKCVKVAHDRLSQILLFEKATSYIYPNPFSSFISCDTTKIKNLVINDLMGKMIFEGQSPNIQTIEWINGIYIAKITNIDNSITYQKLIKTR